MSRQASNTQSTDDTLGIPVGTALPPDLEADALSGLLSPPHQDLSQHQYALDAYDSEGYYDPCNGELMGPGSRYRVLGELGRGTFPSVVRCINVQTAAGATSADQPQILA